MGRLLDLLAILSLVLIFVVLRSLRREYIRVEHSVSWLAAGLALLVLSRSPNLLARMAGWMGLGDATLALLFIVLVVFLGVFYRFSRNVSELKDTTITLTQRISILEFELRKLNEEKQKEKS